MAKQDKSELLNLLVGAATPTADQFRQLVIQLETYDILVKVFILEGTPAVFGASPMKYVIFKEQVAERFNIGSQDVRIVGSARLGFSPSPAKDEAGHEKYGRPFSETSDVDVVIVSESLFHRGSRELFKHLNNLGPAPSSYRGKPTASDVSIHRDDWRKMKDAVRNYIYQNFNPGLLPWDNVLKQDIFGKISSTAGLFLALEPKVFVSKIRCRVFRDWRAAEDYYTNSIRELSAYFDGRAEPELDVEEDSAVPSASDGHKAEKAAAKT